MPVLTSVQVPARTIERKFSVGKAAIDFNNKTIRVDVIPYEKEQGEEDFAQVGDVVVANYRGDDFDSILSTSCNANESLVDAVARIVYQRLINDGHIVGIIQ